jgi:hypothetical protein
MAEIRFSLPIVACGTGMYSGALWVIRPEGIGVAGKAWRQDRSEQNLARMLAASPRG